MLKDVDQKADTYTRMSIVKVLGQLGAQYPEHAQTVIPVFKDVYQNEDEDTRRAIAAKVPWVIDHK